MRVGRVVHCPMGKAWLAQQQDPLGDCIQVLEEKAGLVLMLPSHSWDYRTQSPGIVKQNKTRISEPLIPGSMPPPRFWNHGFPLLDFPALGFDAPGLNMQIRRPQLPDRRFAPLRSASSYLSVQGRLRSSQPFRAASLSSNFAFQSLPHISFY